MKVLVSDLAFYICGSSCSSSPRVRHARFCICSTCNHTGFLREGRFRVVEGQHTAPPAAVQLARPQLVADAVSNLRWRAPHVVVRRGCPRPAVRTITGNVGVAVASHVQAHPSATTHAGWTALRCELGLEACPCRGRTVELVQSGGGTCVPRHSCCLHPKLPVATLPATFDGDKVIQDHGQDHGHE